MHYLPATSSIAAESLWPVFCLMMGWSLVWKTNKKRQHLLNNAPARAKPTSVKLGDGMVELKVLVLTVRQMTTKGTVHCIGLSKGGAADEQQVPALADIGENLPFVLIANTIT
ncbi:uncharacterized protein LOC111077993 [Drosophila obscura]|uniref:uncharacterized protein LOC111077993 n=1 Tax=Drosophila obscura TaxID=7282 RepID=UPI000BA09564|nr:uncharacterized protein LOC111077993 [Drosophila obscura]